MLTLVPKEPQTFELWCGQLLIRGEASTKHELAQKLCNKYGFTTFTHSTGTIICVPGGEKKDAATYTGPSSTACDDQLSAGLGEDM